MATRKKRKIRTIDKDKKMSPVGIFFIRFYKPVTVIATVFIFFFVYNAYIVDRSLADIQFVLEQTSGAQTINDMQGLNMILGGVILKEVANKKMDSGNLIRLDLASSIAAKPKIINQVKDAQFVLSEALAEKNAARNPVLVALDSVNNRVLSTGKALKDILSMAAVKGLVVTELDDEVFLQAKKLQESGDINAAIKAYEDIFKNEPQYQGVEKVNLGYLYQKIENFNRAGIIFEEVIKNAPGSHSAAIAERLLYNLKGLEKLSSEKKKLQDAIDRELSREKLQGMYYELGNIKSRLYDFAGANYAYKKSFELGPDTDVGQKSKFNMAFNYKMDNKYQESEKLFAEISQEAVSDELASGTKYWKADSLRSQGRYDEAAKEFEQLASASGDKSLAQMALFRSGYTYKYDLEDTEKAKLAFGELKNRFDASGISKHTDKEITSDMGAVYRESGFNLLLEGKIEEAMLKFEEAIKVNPNDGLSYSGFSATKGFMKQLQDAVDKAKKGIELAPKNSYVNANMGFVYLLKNDYVKALEFYKKAVELDPKYSEARYNLGLIYQEQGNIDKAIDAYKGAIKYRPKMAQAYNNLGSCYWGMGNIEKAADEFITAVKLNSQSAEAHYNLALTHVVLGRFKQAEAEILKVMELTDSIKDAKSVLDVIRRKML